MAVLGLVLLFGVLQTAVGETCPDPVRLYAKEEVQYFLSHSSYGASNYANNTYSCWTVEAEEHLNVMLNSVVFRLDESTDCTADSGDRLNIHDGESYLKELLENACGLDGVDDVESNGQYAYVEFKTDSQGTGYGFNITYQSIATEEEEESGLGIGAIIGIVVGVVFCLCILGAIIYCVIVCVVIAAHEKKVAQTRGVVYGGGYGNNFNQTSFSTFPPGQGQQQFSTGSGQGQQQFFTGSGQTAAGGAPVFSTPQSAAPLERKSVPHDQ